MSREQLVAEARALFVKAPEPTLCCPRCGVLSKPSYAVSDAHEPWCPRYPILRDEEET